MNRTGTKLLVLSDTQIGAGANLAQDRLGDQERMLARIADLADEHDVDIVLHCGDVFERRHPSEEERLVFKRWASRICMRQRLIVVAGNHDLRNVDLASALDLYDDCEFVREPTVLDLGGAHLACLPWAPTSGIVARLGSRDQDVNGLAAELLVGIARDLMDRCPAGEPALLATHWWLEGATSATGAGESVIHEPVLPLTGGLEEIGFDAIVGGHVHRGEELGRTALMCGTPWVCNFGEADLPHGVWLAQVGDHFQYEFVPIADRAFTTVSVDLTSYHESEDWIRYALPETDAVVAALTLPLTDAVLRLQVRATEEQRRRVDENAIRDLLADAGVHRLHGGIQWDIVREQRARIDGFDAGLGEHAALDAWCDANLTNEEQRIELHELLTESRDRAQEGETLAGGVFVPVTLEAENVGRYRHLRHDFQPGATALVGANGAGKSVILRCVELALYANGGRDLKRELSPWADDLRIELEFTLDGVPHRVRRTYRRAGRTTLDFEVLA